MIVKWTARGLTIAASLCGAVALAQTAPATPAAPPVKVIGKPSTTKPELVSSLIVMNARGVTLQGDKLTLTGVTPNSIIFSDRPARLAGHELTADLIKEWGVGTPGNESFAKEPPNATVSAFSKDGATVRDAVVVLKSPKLEGENLTFTVQVLEGDLKGADGAVSVFIDIFGVWRRAAFRGAVYTGAAAAAYGAYAYHPYAYLYPPPPPACGYYPYPPCY